MEATSQRKERTKDPQDGLALYTAVREGRLPMVKQLLRGVGVNARVPGTGFTAGHGLAALAERNIHKTGQENSRRIAQYLLENGADVSAADNKENMTPLRYLIRHENWVAVEEFVKFGVDVNQPFHPNSQVTLFQRVVLAKKPGLIQVCIDYGADCSRVTDIGLVHLKVALIRDCFPVDGLDKSLMYDNSTPYEHSFTKILLLKHSYSDNLKNFLDMGTVCDAAVNRFIVTESELGNAIRSNKVDVVRRSLREGADPSGCILQERYPVHYCAGRGLAEVLGVLLEHGAPPSSLDPEGRTPLQKAASKNATLCCMVLLRHGACYNYSRAEGETPRELAERVSKEGAVEVFLTVEEIFQMARRGDLKLVDELKKKSTSDFLSFVNCVNTKGNTLMGEALKWGRRQVAEDIMKLRLRI